jgi:membrane protein
MIEISTKLNHCLKNLNCDFSVNITRTCELDITELIKCDILNENYLFEICEKLFKEIQRVKSENNEIPNWQLKFLKNPISKELKNQYTIEHHTGLLRFIFYFDYDKNELKIFNIFYLEKSNRKISKFDFCLITLEVILYIMSSCYYRFSDIGIFSILCLAHIVILFICCNKVSYAIWIDKNSKNIFRKWYRSIQFENEWMLYYFISWLNIWLFSLFILTVPNKLPIIGNIDLVSTILITVFLMVYAFHRLLKVVKISWKQLIVLIIGIFIAGFYSKDYWVVVALIFVVVNQMLSKDLLYLSSKVSDHKIRDNQGAINLIKRERKEIRMKSIANIVMIFLYLFTIFFNRSYIVTPIIKVLNPDIKINSELCFFFLGIERVLLLSLFIVIIYSTRKKLLLFYQNLVDKIVDFFYQENETPLPVFKKEIEFYIGEDIQPKDMIDNIEELPPETKVIWIKEPKGLSCIAEVLVIYPDRTTYYQKVTVKKIPFYG